MEISKTVFNMAAKRELEIEIVKFDSGNDQLWFWDNENESEPVLMYDFQEEGLFFQGQTSSKLQDLPYWIKDQNQLKEVVKYVAATIY